MLFHRFFQHFLLISTNRYAQMQFFDVLLRLIPFSASNNGETVFFIGMQGGDWIITVFILVLWGICIYLLLNKKLRKDKSLLAQLKKDLHEIEQTTDNAIFIQKIYELTTDTLAKASWENFSKNLIVTKNQEQKIIYHRIYDSALFFNKDTLLNFISKPLFNSGSSFLLSIGLLGTFFGLFYGLIQLNLDNAETLQESMRVLINASGAKFSSSIWGLGLATLYSFLEKQITNQTSKDISEIQEVLNNRFPLIVAEQIQQSSLDINNESLELQQSLITTTQDSYGVLNTLADDMAEAIGTRLSNTIIDGMKQSMQTLVDNIGGSKDATLHHALSELKSGVGGDFSAKLEVVLQDFINEIKKSTGADADNLKEQLSQMGTLVSGLTNSVSTQTTKMNDFINLLEDKIGQITKGSTESTKAIVEATTSAGKNVAEAAQPIVNIVEKIVSLSNKLDSISENMNVFKASTDNLRDASNNTLQSTQELGNAIDTLSLTSGTMAGVTASFKKDLDDATDTLKTLPLEFKQIAEMTGTISQDAEQTYQGLANSHSNLLKSNQQSTEELMQIFTEYQQTIQDSIKTILDETSNGIEVYKNKSDEHIRSNLKTQQDALNKYVDEANKLLITAISNYDGQLTKFANELSSAVAELNDAIEQLSSKLSKGK